jgi:hypothetical protein
VSGLERQVLEDAALELGVDLEMFRLDQAESGKAAEGPFEEFVYFYGSIEALPPDGSTVGDLCPRQLCFAAA